jgi:hypothetical protein
MSKLIIPTAAILSPSVAKTWGDYDGSNDGAIFDSSLNAKNGHGIALVNSGMVGMFYNDTSNYQMAVLQYAGKTINSVGSPTSIFTQNELIYSWSFAMGNIMLNTYEDVGTPNTYIVPCTVSGGGSITVGTPVTFSRQATTKAQCGKPIDSSNMIFCVNALNGGVGGNRNAAQGASLSGDVFSFGTISFSSPSNEANAIFRNICSLSTTRGLGVWTSALSGNARVFPFTLSSGTPTAAISVDTSMPVESSAGTCDLAPINSTQAVLVVSCDLGGKAMVVTTTNGTTVTLGTAYTFDSNVQTIAPVIIVDNFVIITYLRKSSKKTMVVVGEISGTTITFGTPVDVNMTATTWEQITATLLDPTHIMIGSVLSTGNANYKIITP